MPNQTEHKESLDDEGIVEFAEELSNALITRGLDPKDDKVQKTVAVCGEAFGEIIADVGKTMTELNGRLSKLVAKKTAR